jgi:hypothetical protein
MRSRSLPSIVAVLVLPAVLARGGEADKPDAIPCGSSEGIEAGPRLASWMEQRKAKCAHLTPYKPNLLERQILAFEKAERPSIAEVNFLGVYPRVQTIDHRSQLAGGFRFWRPDLEGSRFDIAADAFWSLQGFRYYGAQAGVVPHQGKDFPLFPFKGDEVFELANVRQGDDTPYMLYGSFSHRWAPKFDFFGIGPGSRAADQASFRQRDNMFEAVAGYRVLRGLTLSGRLGFYDVALGPGADKVLPQIEEVFDAATVPGLRGQPSFFRFGGAAIFDARDVARNPHRGGLLAAEWLRYAQRGGGAGTFSRYAVDGRAYVTLGRPQRVLALRAYLSKDDPAPGARVPFYLMAYLGGSHTLRAFDSQRFRGEKLALLQAEYRWEASPSIELALFLDRGAVAATTDDPLDEFRTDGGIGLRFKTHERTIVRFDVAWGGEGTRLAFRFNPSF